MKGAIIIYFFALAAVAFARPEEHYTSTYDNLNIQEILENDRLLDGYFSCVIGKGKCTPPGNELKSHLQDALETECSKCTKPQREGTEQVIAHLIKHKPEYWTQLTAKFDPSGKYATKYEKQYKEIKEKL